MWRIERDILSSMFYSLNKNTSRWIKNWQDLFNNIIFNVIFLILCSWFVIISFVYYYKEQNKARIIMIINKNIRSILLDLQMNTWTNTFHLSIFHSFCCQSQRTKFHSLISFWSCRYRSFLSSRGFLMFSDRRKGRRHHSMDDIYRITILISR